MGSRTEGVGSVVWLSPCWAIVAGGWLMLACGGSAYAEAKSTVNNNGPGDATAAAIGGNAGTFGNGPASVSTAQPLAQDPTPGHRLISIPRRGDRDLFPIPIDSTPAGGT